MQRNRPSEFRPWANPRAPQRPEPGRIVLLALTAVWLAGGVGFLHGSVGRATPEILEKGLSSSTLLYFRLQDVHDLYSALEDPESPSKDLVSLLASGFLPWVRDSLAFPSSFLRVVRRSTPAHTKAEGTGDRRMGPLRGLRLSLEITPEPKPGEAKLAWILELIPREGEGRLDALVATVLSCFRDGPFSSAPTAPSIEVRCLGDRKSESRMFLAHPGSTLLLSTGMDTLEHYLMAATPAAEPKTKTAAQKRPAPKWMTGLTRIETPRIAGGIGEVFVNVPLTLRHPTSNRQSDDLSPEMGQMLSGLGLESLAGLRYGFDFSKTSIEEELILHCPGPREGLLKFLGAFRSGPALDRPLGVGESNISLEARVELADLVDGYFAVERTLNRENAARLAGAATRFETDADLDLAGMATEAFPSVARVSFQSTSTMPLVPEFVARIDVNRAPRAEQLLRKAFLWSGANRILSLPHRGTTIHYAPSPKLAPSTPAMIVGDDGLYLSASPYSLLRFVDRQSKKSPGADQPEPSRNLSRLPDAKRGPGNDGKRSQTGSPGLVLELDLDRTASSEIRSLVSDQSADASRLSLQLLSDSEGIHLSARSGVSLGGLMLRSLFTSLNPEPERPAKGARRLAPPGGPGETADSLLSWGNRLQVSGDHEGALVCFDLCLEKAPNRNDARFRRGLSLTRLGRYEEAKRDFEKCDKGEFLKAYSLYNLGCCDAQLGNIDEAFEWLKKSVEAGFRDFDQMAGDSDLTVLRSDPRFRNLLRSR